MMPKVPQNFEHHFKKEKKTLGFNGSVKPLQLGCPKASLNNFQSLISDRDNFNIFNTIGYSI